MLKRAATLISVLAISACASAPASLMLTSAGSIQASNQPLGPSRSFNVFAGHRDLYTEIHGNPFNMENEEFRQDIVGILNLRNSESPTNFATKPDNSADPAFRVVLVFNAAGHYNPYTICRRPNTIKTEAPHTDRIPFSMVFCNVGTELNSVQGTFPAAENPQDHRFQDSLALALTMSQPRDTVGGR